MINKADKKKFKNIQNTNIRNKIDKRKYIK